MPKVIFKFDEEKDLWNLWATATANNRWHDFRKEVSPNIVEMCRGRRFDECKSQLQKLMKNVYEKKIIEIYRKFLQKAWKIIEEEYFRRMDKIFKKKSSFKNIIAYITTSGRCPYDPKEPSFMISLFYSLPSSLSTCGHEIMHLYFHKFYWKDIEKKIGEEKTADLKEALTVLLNLEFKDLWFTEDRGYEPHQELRKFIVEKWKEEKDFEKLLEKCVEYLR